MLQIKKVFKFLYYKFWLITPKRIVNRVYSYVLKRPMNWSNPQNLNEKINWLKIYGDTSKWSELADKYKVRDFVKSKGLEKILVPLYGAWDKPENVDFNLLPNDFVIKTNHGSGEIIVVKDKSKVNFEEIRKKLSIWLKERYGYYQGEPHYLGIEPRIIAEKLLYEKENDFSSSLVDYKVWCFNGVPYCVWVCYNRSVECAYVATYDLNWNYHPEYSVFTEHYRDGGNVVKKPKSFNEMMDAAKVLSKGFPEVRVDFYDIDGQLYFGEMTFTSNGGYMQFFTDDYLLQMGEQIKLCK